MKVYDWIATYANRTPDKIAQIDWHSNRKFTYEEMHHRVGALCGYLRDDLGVKKGDRIAVLSLNTSDSFEVNFACARLGAVFVPLNIRLMEQELAYMISDISANILFCGKEFWEMGQALQKNCGFEYLRSFNGDGSESDYERGIASGKVILEIEELTMDDLYVILFTSGTTGRPKGAMLTHSMAFSHAVNLGNTCHLTKDSINLTILPIFHTGGLNVLAVPTFHVGGTVITIRQVNPPEVLQIIGDQAVGVSHFVAVPSIYQFMANEPGFADYDFSHVKGAMVGGAPSTLSVLKTWNAAGLKLMNVYGMTETGPVVLALDGEDAIRKVGSVGKPVLHVDLKLVKADGTSPEVNEVAEIWVKGPCITPGYWERPEANEKEFVDGWLKTGDAAYMDEDGYYFIADRWKDMYISGGENVYPAEVESIINELEPILEVAVVGTTDEKWGEVGHAFIALKEGKSLSKEEVFAHCRKQMAKFKNPVYITFLKELPHNATGKILKRELRKMV